MGKKKRKSTPAVAPTDRTRIEHAKAALAKRKSKKRLTRDDERAIAWFEQYTRDQVLSEGLRALPKGTYCQLAGRQQKLVNDHARRYKLPLLGKTVDLFEVITAFHDLLVDNKGRVVALGDEEKEGDLATEKLRAEVESKHLANEEKRLNLQAKKGSLIAVTEMRTSLDWLRNKLRDFGSGLGKRFGPPAQKMFNDLMSSLEKEIKDGTFAEVVGDSNDGD